MAEDKRPGVRGPRGPQSNASSGKPSKGSSGKATSSRPGAPSTLQRVSIPVLLYLNRLPRWALVVLIGSLFVLGIVLSGPFAWLGALIIALLGVLFGWLLALSWPALGASGRLLRTVVVVGLFGFAILKALGRL